MMKIQYYLLVIKVPAFCGRKPVDNCLKDNICIGKAFIVLKQFYRIIILIVIFTVSLIYFSRDIKEVVFDIKDTTQMEETTFPLVAIKADDNKINLMHGYSSSIASNSIREAVTPLKPDKSFEAVIKQYGYDIKKLDYEIRDYVTDDLMEKGSVSVFDEESDGKTARIKLESELEKGREYTCKLTLTSSESRKFYYYHRVKLYEEPYLSEKLDFIMYFHDSIRDSDKAEDIKKYLEPDKNADNSSYARVDIHSSFELITWGGLKPEIITEIIPSIVEIYPDIASVTLKYMVRISDSGKQKLYEVKEYYRVRYTPDRMYLLNYERSMEELFDPNLESSDGIMKLGITADNRVPYLISADKKKLAFVRSRQLWFYDLDADELVRVFSFRQENTDYIRDLYDQHDVRLLSMDSEGNINFLVYGYMNRGHYEGRVALILYKYIRASNSIEEKVYIPVDEPYQSLKEKLGDFTYCSMSDIFYFHMNGNIYAYNLTTKELNELAHRIDKEDIVFLQDLNYAAWQASSDPVLSDELLIMEIETGRVRSIKARNGYSIFLLDRIEDNLIYGFASLNDITTAIDGRVIVPMSTLEIASLDMEVLKTYSKPGYHITDLEVKDNTIMLSRVFIQHEFGKTFFEPAPQDYIMNQVRNIKPALDVVSVTGDNLTEWQLKLPDGFAGKNVPKPKATLNTVITKDTVLRLPVDEDDITLYYAYAAGEIIGVYSEAYKAIRAANDYTGVVLDNEGRLVWERGVKASKNIISGFEDPLMVSADSIESCIGLIVRHLGRQISGGPVKLEGRSAYEVMKINMEETPVCLTGASLDEVLYYVSEGRPVLAMISRQEAILIYGYDNYNIYAVDTVQDKLIKLGIKDSTSMFEEAGNVFLSYLE